MRRRDQGEILRQYCEVNKLGLSALGCHVASLAVVAADVPYGVLWGRAIEDDPDAYVMYGPEVDTWAMLNSSIEYGHGAHCDMKTIQRWKRIFRKVIAKRRVKRPTRLRARRARPTRLRAAA